MSFSSNNFLLNIDKPSVKTKNKPKKIFPSKPSYLLPSTTLKCFKEKEAQNIKKDILNQFNNHPLNISLKPHIRNRNYNSKDMTLSNNTLNNSIKNVHILLKNNNNDYKNVININNNLLITNNSIKNFYNFCDNNEENKENLKNKYNTNNGNINNYIIKNDKIIIVNKANKFIKENKTNNNIYKKVNLRPKSKRRTLSSNITKIILNDNKNIKKSFNNDINNFKNSLFIDVFSNHRKNNSIIMNIN